MDDDSFSDCPNVQCCILVMPIEDFCDDSAQTNSNNSIVDLGVEILKIQVLFGSLLRRQLVLWFALLLCTTQSGG